MAHCPRSAKSATNWTDTELYGLNIRVVDVDAATFFELDGPEFPPSTASEVILNNTNRPGGPLTKDDRQFFQYMDLLQQVPPGAPWPRVADFSAFIARMMNYDDKNCLIFQRVDVPFPMVGKFVYSKLDVCLMNVHNGKLLLHIHENKVVSRLDPSTDRIADELFESRRLVILTPQLLPKPSLFFITTIRSSKQPNPSPRCR